MAEIFNYNGNANLKSKNVSIEWDSEKIEEYLKCQDDPIYFIEKYVKIINIDEGLVPFVLYDYQKEIVLSVTNNRNTVINTARQAGKSTTIVAFILHYIIFNSEKTVALLANKAETAREILGRVQLAYEHLPSWLQQGVLEWNKGSIKLENNSRIIASATSGSAIRGYSINLLFIDEAAHIDNWDEFFTSVFPTISSGKTTKVVLVSTPNGLNHFHKIVSDALEGKNNYNCIEIPWFKVPGRDEAWKKEIIAGMGGDLSKFAQEHSCEFLGSSGTLIAGQTLKNMRSMKPIQEVDNNRMFFAPEPDKIYVMTCDVSRGKGLDYSAFSVIDITEMPYRQVFSFRDNLITTGDYAAIINQIAKLYNMAYVLVEINDIGAEVSNLLLNEWEYDNILSTENKGMKGKRLSSGFGSNVDLGIRTTKTVKAIGCSMLKSMVEQTQLIINDEQTLDELKTFSKKRSSYEAESGKNDDLVTTLFLFGWLTSQEFFKEMNDINTLQMLRERTNEEMEASLMPFGIIYDAAEEYRESTNGITEISDGGFDSWMNE